MGLEESLAQEAFEQVHGLLTDASAGFAAAGHSTGRCCVTTCLARVTTCLAPHAASLDSEKFAALLLPLCNLLQAGLLQILSPRPSRCGW